MLNNEQIYNKKLFEVCNQQNVYFTNKNQSKDENKFVNEKHKTETSQEKYSKKNLEYSEFLPKTKKKIIRFLKISKFSLQDGYYCYPDLQQLNKMKEDELCQVQGFIIGNDFGEIRFLQPIDLTDICLENVFDIQRHSIEVYPKQYYDTETCTRYVKRGVNRIAILIYKQFFKKIPKKSTKLEKKIELDCLLKGVDFVQIDYKKNELWVRSHFFKQLNNIKIFKFFMLNNQKEVKNQAYTVIFLKLKFIYYIMQIEEEYFQILLNQEEANFIKKILPPQYFLNQVPKTGKNKYLISSETLLKAANKIKDNKLSQNSGPYKKCQKILNTLKQHRSAEPFSEPVDPIALGIPTYFDVVKNPMDLSSVETKFRGNRYKSPYQFFQDIELIWSNAFSFNLPETEVYQMCQEMEEEYLQLKRREFGEKLEQEAKLKELLTKFKKMMKPEEKEEEIKYLDQEEYVQLAQNIRKLPNQYIYGVIEIMQLYHPEYNFNQSQEINLESLSDVCIYKIQKYVNRCVGNLEKKKAHKNKAQLNLYFNNDKKN